MNDGKGAPNRATQSQQSNRFVRRGGDLLENQLKEMIKRKVNNEITKIE